MIQWHPLFAALLRHVVEDYYSVETNMPVGDLPREADIVLLRRTATTPPPFRGIWRHLTPWNVLEFKGPTDDPALRDIDLLLEVGLGIDRRLNERGTREGSPLLERADVSFWYLANHLGRRFLAEAQALFGACEVLTEGLWRCGALQRAVFLVSRDTLPVEAETVPLHLVCQEPAPVKLQVAQVVLQQPGWWQRYGPFLAMFHPHLQQEITRMAQLSETDSGVNMKEWIKALGVPEVAQALIETIGLPEAVKLFGLKQIIDAVGVKRAIEEVGLQRVIAEVGPRQVVAELGPDEFLAGLTPEQRAALKDRLQ
jgi:hypothetical protein